MRLGIIIGGVVALVSCTGSYGPGAQQASPDEGLAAAELQQEEMENEMPVQDRMVGPEILEIPEMRLNSELTLSQVTHELYKPSFTGAPHPFYKKFCATQGPAQRYTTATGLGTFHYNQATKTVEFRLTWSDLSGAPIMMHFHRGAPGKAGPIVQTICGHPPPGSKDLGFSPPPVSDGTCNNSETGQLNAIWRIKGNDQLDPPMTEADMVRALLAGELYVNIHTCLNELGEIRGQVVPIGGGKPAPIKDGSGLPVESDMLEGGGDEQPAPDTSP
jgi:hypothetical protein